MSGDFKDFNATNEPGTCLWCGRKLPRRNVTRWVKVTPDDPEYAHGHREKEVPTGEVEIGYMDDQHFCSLRCGYLFGVSMANHGRRLTKD